MAYTLKTQALDAICRSQGGDGGHVRVIRALNEWCGLLGGAGGHVRNVRALNEICRLLGAEDGHFREIRALNAIAARLGGAGGHRLSLAALAEIAALTATGWAPGPVRLFGAGDSRFADGRQGMPPYDAGYVLHRYSALNLAVWGLRGRVVHDARADLFATAGSTLEQWIGAHLAPLLAAMAGAANPVVLIHLGTHSLPWVPLADMQAQAGAIIAALTAAGGRVLWLLENPRSGGSALSPENEAKRLAYNAWLKAQDGAHAGRFLTVDYLPAFTADGSATGDAAAPGLQRDGLHDAQAGASVKAAAARAILESLPPVAAAAEHAGAAAAYDPEANPFGNRLDPVGWTGEVRTPDDTGAGSSLACAFSTEVAAGRTWQVMQLGGAGGNGENARLYQAPFAAGYAGGDTVRFRVRVAWENLAGVRSVKVVVFHYGSGFFGVNAGSAGAGPAPGGAHEELLEGTMVLSASPSFFQMKLMVEADGAGPVSGAVRWADAELRRIA
jgi:hypothetical protein